MPATMLPTILAEAKDSGARVLSVEGVESDLEVVFLQLTGRALRNLASANHRSHSGAPQPTIERRSAVAESADRTFVCVGGGT